MNNEEKIYNDIFEGMHKLERKLIYLNHTVFPYDGDLKSYLSRVDDITREILKDIIGLALQAATANYNLDNE